MIKKNYKTEKYETREEWLKARGFGGSSACAILGKDKYISVIDVYNNYIFGKEIKDGKPNVSQQYGIDNEPLIRKMFMFDFTEWEVREPDGYEMFRRKDKPFMTATIDGQATNKETKEKIVIEIKTHDWKSGDENEWNNTIPFKYFVQCCHYLSVLNDFDGAVLVAKIRFFDYKNNKRVVSKQEIRYYWLWKSDQSVQQAIENIEKAETNFYENHIKPKIPPKSIISF